MRPEMGECCEQHVLHSEAVDRAKDTLVSEHEASNLAETFKILGDPTRVRLIQALSAGELCVCDLAAVLDMTQSAVSHQLRLLRGMNIVKGRRDGKVVFYSLDDDHVVQLLSQALEHIRHTGGNK